MAHNPLPPLGQDDMAGSLPVVIASDQSAVPVSGTITANLGTLNGAATSAKQDTIIGHVDGIETLIGTTNSTLSTIDGHVDGLETSTASIDTKTPALGQALAAASVPVVLPAAQITTLTPPAAITGFATAAKQDAIIGHVDGIEGLLTTIDADTGNVSTKIDTLAAAVSGTEFQVDVLTMPTTTVQATDLDIRNLTATDVVTANLSATDNAVLDNIDSSTAAVNTVIGAKTDAKSTATDATSVSAMQVLKQISASVQAPPSQAVTNGGTFATQATIQAGTALIGQASTSGETSTIYNGTTALTPKFAAIAVSSSGNNTLVAAVTSKKIRVLAYNFIANGAVNAKFQSGAGGTDLTGLKYCVANSGICAPFNPVGWFETASNTLLNLNLSGATAVGGELVYVEV